MCFRMNRGVRTASLGFCCVMGTVVEIRTELYKTGLELRPSLFGASVGHTALLKHNSAPPAGITQGTLGDSKRGYKVRPDGKY